MNRDQIVKFIEDIFNLEFEHAYIDEWFQENGQTISGNLHNLCFWNTRFYAQSWGKKYLHFTSSKNAVKILNSGSLWLTNLNTFNDKLEFLHAARKLLNISKDLLNGFKDNLFAACFTELTRKQNVFIDFPYHWSRYSNGGDGVALEFDFGPKYKDAILEDSVLRPFYYLMRVQYQDDLDKDNTIVKLKNKIEELRKKSGFNELGLVKFLFPFLCAYKREKCENESFNSEKEIRLFYSDSIDSIDCNFYTDDNNREETFAGIENVAYRPFRQLPYNTNNTFLKLKTIFLGVNLNIGDKSNIKGLASNTGFSWVTKD